ncbi:RICIN domain-containing protein [Candidatus Saccharibacteria bacterium]|nr:RICIN domain-containing protein [Candidatus Saccharibacteria bacterium]
MVRITHIWRNKFVMVVSFVVLATMAAMSNTDIVHAENCSNTGATCYNSVTADLPSYCDRIGSNRCAGPWFSDPGSSYYSIGITIDWNQTGDVNVMIRGAGYSKFSSQDNVYSTGLSMNNVFYSNGTMPYPLSSSGAQGWETTALHSVSSDYNYRGTTQNGNGNWTNQGSEISAKLNLARAGVTNVLPRPGETKTIQVPMFSCFTINNTTPPSGWNQPSSYAYPSCDTSMVPIQVTRRSAPQWNISVTTTIDKTTALPGETVTWKHTMRESNNSDVRHDEGDWIGETGDTLVRPTGNIYQYTNTTGVAPVVQNKIECVVPNGTYRIASAAVPAMRLDVSGGLNNGNAIIYEGSTQTWTLTCGTDGFYTIKNVRPEGSGSNGQVLDVAWGLTLSGTSVGVYDNNGTAAQKWRIVPIDSTSGNYRIYNQSGLALDINGGTYTNNTRVQVWLPNGTHAQGWKVLNTSTNSEIFPTTLVYNESKGTNSAKLPASWHMFNDKAVSYTITSADVGKKVCQLVRSNWSYSNNFRDKDSDPKCVTVQNPYAYELIPETTVVDGGGGTGGDVTYGDRARFKGNIRNTGPDNSRETDWEAFIFVIPRGGGTAEAQSRTVGGTLSNSVINSVYHLVNVRDYEFVGSHTNPHNCVVHSTRGIFSPDSISNSEIVCQTGDLTDRLNTLDLGDQFCFAIRVWPSWASPDYPTPANDYSYSRPACLTISKSPQIQLRGADSRSGAARFGQTVLTDSKYKGGFEGNFSANEQRGSWSQFGLLSNGGITNFGANGYTFATADSRSKACKLHFANVVDGSANCDGSLSGNFGQTDRIITIPKVAEWSAADLQGFANVGQIKELTNISFSLEGLESGTYYLKQSTTIEASRLSKNQRLVLVAADPNHTITIAGNIEVNPTDRYDDLREIPSLTVIADKIYVQGFSSISGNRIEKIFGTYIAKERFNTCNLGTDSALAGIATYNSASVDQEGLCQNQLTVQGAVISRDRPNFWRTYGASRDDASAPSEIFQYTPNLYLTPFTLGINDGANDWRLTDLRQLPARL